MSLHFPEISVYTEALQPLLCSQLAQGPETPFKHSFMSPWQKFPLFPSLLAQLRSLLVSGQHLFKLQICVQPHSWVLLLPELIRVLQVTGFMKMFLLFWY